MVTSSSFERDDGILLSAATCPIRAARFNEPVFLENDYREGINTWTECAEECAKKPKCQYWEYFSNSNNELAMENKKKCGLLKDYESVRSLPGIR